MSFLINSYRFGSALSYLLDTYTAAAAYSLQQLKTGVTAVVRVRRSSDNAESDFTATEITNGTLTTWVGGGNSGFVVTWYDQSGNAYHATNSTTSQQPRIVNAGTLETLNGKPAVQFIRANSTRLITTGTTAAFNNYHQGVATAIYTGSLVQSGTNFLVITDTTGAGAATSRGFWWGVRSTNLEILVSRSISGAYAAYQNAGAYTSGNQYIFWAQFDALNGTANQRLKAALNNGTETNTNTESGTGTDGSASQVLRIGSATSSGYWDGKMQEILLFNADMAANKTALHTEINSRYGVY